MELGNSSRPTHLTISTAPSSLAAIYATLCLFCFLLFRSPNQARRLKARHGSELGATFKTNHLFFHIKHGGHRELASVATGMCLSERRKTTEPSLFLKFSFFWIFSRIRCSVIIMQYFILKIKYCIFVYCIIWLKWQFASEVTCDEPKQVSGVKIKMFIIPLCAWHV